MVKSPCLTSLQIIGIGESVSSILYRLLEFGCLPVPGLTAPSQGRVADPNITKYAVKVLPFNYDQSAYGFREFFKRHGIRSSDDAK
ncbi:unnamed protein product [Camellia sinensis]